MKFPKALYHGYQIIRNCALVKNKDFSTEALQEFETMLNSCQPQLADMERFNTVKDFYNTSKYNFQRFIRNTALECTILWTESKSIVSWFHLRGVIYLSYDVKNQKYHVQLHRNLEGKDHKLDLDLGLEEFPSLNYDETKNV
jgi:hypothetical protein